MSDRVGIVPIGVNVFPLRREQRMDLADVEQMLGVEIWTRGSRSPPQNQRRGSARGGVTATDALLIAQSMHSLWDTGTIQTGTN